jgi:hypothetical protein
LGIRALVSFLAGMAATAMPYIVVIKQAEVYAFPLPHEGQHFYAAVGRAEM